MRPSSIKHLPLQTSVVTRSSTFAMISVAIMLVGCKTTPPPPAPPPLVLSGGIGVAAFLSTGYETGVGKIAAQEGFSWGAGTIKGMAAVPPIIVLAPFFALYGAVHGAVCDQKFESAYPNLQASFGDIVRREFATADVRESFANAFQKHTTTQIATVEGPAEASAEITEQRLLDAAAQQSLAYLFIAEIQGVEATPWDRDCDSSAVVRIPVTITLWSVAERKTVLQTGSRPFVRRRLTDLKDLFDEPGALRKELAAVFQVAAEDLLYATPRRFELPQ